MTSAVVSCDFLVIGAGIAGAGCACELAARGHVIVVEREAQPGYHTTGRSAALFAPTYGSAVIRALTAASRDFFDRPPAGFCTVPLLTPRGELWVAAHDRVAALERLHAQLAADPSTGGETSSLVRLEPADTIARVPCLRLDRVGAALFGNDAMDIDVDALHQGYLRGLRARGGQIVCNADVQSLERRTDGWFCATRAGGFNAAVVINAAGAWADEIGQLAGAAPIGLVPKRRTAITFDPPADIATANWPAVIDIDEQWYFKPDAGRLLASPADETPSSPCDAQPEDLDIAILVDRLERATTLAVPRLRAKWAGLRSFVADKNPVIGFDPALSGFFWLAGQGGYGIQTAPAAARVAAALACADKLPDDVTARHVNRADLAAGRFSAS